MVVKTTKKDVNKVKPKTGKKCRTCSLDCSIIREPSLVGVPNSERSAKAIAMFGSEKPRYTPETCPKR